MRFHFVMKIISIIIGNLGIKLGTLKQIIGTFFTHLGFLDGGNRAGNIIGPEILEPEAGIISLILNFRNERLEVFVHTSSNLKKNFVRVKSGKNFVCKKIPSLR